MNDYNVKDIDLADEGEKKVEWVEDHMPVLMEIRNQFRQEKPLEGTTIGICLHVTKETAALVRTLETGGAQVAITSCNPLSTQDDVAAFLARKGTNVYAWRGESEDEYYENIDKVLDSEPNITLDDGADLVSQIHSERPELIENIVGGQEETTTGVVRLKNMHKDGALKYPIIAVNNAKTKHFFDNRYGTGQSTIDGIIRATNILFAGKTVVVAGYGFCGRGIAMRAEGMGAKVIVTEVSPVKALEAKMDGFEVMPMKEAAKMGDIFVTATGDKDVITKEYFKLMKDGAILANSGHFNVEVKVSDLEKLASRKEKIKEDVEKYELEDKSLYLLGEGRLINLVAAEGHPPEVMDMSFANQALCAKYFLENKMETKIHTVPEEIDSRVAQLKLETMGVDIDDLTPEQEEYLDSWDQGT